MVSTATRELLVVCKLVERNLLLYFLEMVSSLLTRAATCDGLVFGIESCEKTNIAIRVINPIKLKIAMMILVFLSKPSAGGGVAI